MSVYRQVGSEAFAEYLGSLSSYVQVGLHYENPSEDSPVEITVRSGYKTGVIAAYSEVDEDGTASYYVDSSLLNDLT